MCWVVAAKAEAYLNHYQTEHMPLKNQKIKSGVMERVMEAVQKLGLTMTAGGVSAVAGVSTNEAEDALAALVAATDGTLEVELLSWNLLCFTARLHTGGVRGGMGIGARPGPFVGGHNYQGRCLLQ